MTKAKDLPVHVAVIMDGNGRWARVRGLPRVEGHRAGAEAVRRILQACGRHPHIRFLTLYAFSSENWKRPRAEIRFLFRALEETIRAETENLLEKGIRLVVSGRRAGLPGNMLKSLDRVMERTERGKFTLNVALNYGGRGEIVDAAEAYAADVKAGRRKGGSLDEDAFRSYLYHPEIPDPDLVIRTSGEKRLSNFLVWQAAYSELWITRVLWPDFQARHLEMALKDYSRRERRYGDIHA